MTIAIEVTEGQLPASKTTLYQVPSGSKAYFKAISLFNAGVATETVKLYVNHATGTSRRLPGVVLLTLESAVYEAFALEGGDLLEGETTNAASVDYIISVVEEF